MTEPGLLARQVTHISPLTAAGASLPPFARPFVPSLEEFLFLLWLRSPLERSHIFLPSRFRMLII